MVFNLQTKQARSHGASRLVAIAGGAAEVGCTSIAANLAVALSQQQSVLLVDCDLEHAGATAWCNLTPSLTIVDALQRRSPLEDIIVSGPDQIEVLPNLWGANQLLHHDSATAEFFVTELLRCALQRWILLDLGADSNEWTRVLWHSSEQQLIVTAPDSSSLLATYSMLKRRADVESSPVEVVVNRAQDPRSAQAAYEGLQTSVRQFLHSDIRWLGLITEDPQLHAAGSYRRPILAHAAQCPAARQIHYLAETMIQRQCSTADDADHDASTRVVSAA